MAATINFDNPLPSARVIAIQGDSSYATGGYAAPPLFAQVGVNPVGLNTGAVIGLYDAVNNKVKFITASTGAEVSNASNQSAVTVKVLLYS